MLRLAGRGVPVSWTPEAHKRFPGTFRQRVRDLLRAIYTTPVRLLPSGVRDEIIMQAVRPLARAAVWGMMSDSAVEAHEEGARAAQEAAQARAAAQAAAQDRRAPRRGQQA